MLRTFALRNYKNFRDEIKIDFGNVAGYQFSTDCITDGLISKMLIYGRNATGKTNFGKAIMDIGSTMFGGPGYIENGVFLNADSEEDSAGFSYIFDFDEMELIYQYSRFSNQELRDEELVINGVSIFRCDFLNKEYHFDNLKCVDAETANVERYLQVLEGGEETEGVIEPKLPFLRWLISNVALKNDSILIRLANYVRRMVMITVGNEMPYRVRRMSKAFYDSLENPERLKDLEDFLNAMGIECRLILEKLPDGQKELYFAHEKLVPFYENASSGTLALVDLYRRLIPKVWDASLIYLDEFDAFYHYEMAENVIKFFKKKYPRCQMIMTSHNTNLMTNRLMRPDCMFILSRRGTLTALCNATTRELREGHNLEKMYISGEFEKYE
ncbi:MAG: ATP-binding protein [Lachnospiraceae bacterium]|nr:ATP-binding protein [Lachnospiraceae bacterium]